MRKTRILLVLMLTALGLIVATPNASAATVSCNLAAFMPTSGSDPYGDYEELNHEKAVNEDLYAGFGGAFVANDTDPSTTWWKVDLGQARDIDYVTIYAQSPNVEERIDGAWLRAYDVNDVQMGSEIVLGGYNGLEVWSQDWDNGGAGWSGVRYFMVGGADGHGPSQGPGDAPLGLAMAEFLAYGQVETYTNFITGITATASNTYADGGYDPIQAQYLVDNSAMSDVTEKYLIGNPNATHKMISTDFWCTDTLEVGETPTLDFDLGAEYDLTQMLVWNSNQSMTCLDRGLKDVLIETSTDGTSWTTLTDQNGAEAGNLTIGISPATETGEAIPCTGDMDLTGATARYVRLTALTSHGATENWGLTEVRFYGTESSAAIPGDTNDDGIVNETDATVVATNWHDSVTPGDYTSGDFNNDGVVNAIDASIMAAQWGNHNESQGEGTVPEPSALVLLLGMLCGVVVRRRKSC